VIPQIDAPDGALVVGQLAVGLGVGLGARGFGRGSVGLIPLGFGRGSVALRVVRSARQLLGRKEGRRPHAPLDPVCIKEPEGRARVEPGQHQQGTANRPQIVHTGSVR